MALNITGKRSSRPACDRQMIRRSAMDALNAVSLTARILSRHESVIALPFRFQTRLFFLRSFFECERLDGFNKSPLASNRSISPRCSRKSRVVSSSFSRRSMLESRSAVDRARKRAECFDTSCPVLGVENLLNAKAMKFVRGSFSARTSKEL
jgi:hypothetical protein